MMNEVNADLPDEEAEAEIEQNIDRTIEVAANRASRRGRPKKTAAQQEQQYQQLPRAKKRKEPIDDDYKELEPVTKQSKHVDPEGSSRSPI